LDVKDFAKHTPLPRSPMPKPSSLPPFGHLASPWWPLLSGRNGLVFHPFDLANITKKLGHWTWFNPGVIL
jgi:hypothetical protein